MGLKLSYVRLLFLVCTITTVWVTFLSPDKQAWFPAPLQDDSPVVSMAPTQKSCKCLNCTEDLLCGRLWEGNIIRGSVRDVHQIEIHVVVSHCKTDLGFLADSLRGLNVASIHVISKCGHPVEGAPPDSTIQILPNVGRCDHAFAFYITSVLDKKLQLGSAKENGDNAVVMFLKDTLNPKINNRRQPGRWNTFQNMIQVASSDTGFSCGVLPGWSKQFPKYTMSAFYELKTLRKFRKTEYESRTDYNGDGVPFHSKLSTWELFYNNLGAGPLQEELVQVCFGGVFAASVRAIKAVDIEVWRTAEQSLSRGNNIQEGHYMERIWAKLLALPLEPYQVEALKNHTDMVFRRGYGGNIAFTGALAKKV
eukprot:scaffold19_cov114-Cylindrotheca_fusiformis.AAC.38